jgi:hypothetical protein
MKQESARVNHYFLSFPNLYIFYVLLYYTLLKITKIQINMVHLEPKLEVL